MTEPSWTSKDDNRMVISQAMQHVMVNVVPDQHDEITRIRGFALCVALDITFPWAHPEYCTNLGTDYDQTIIERALRTADLVTTSYEQLVPEITELNPNVIHIPDACDDIEGWEIGATALFTMAMQKCVTKRTGA